MKAADKLNSNVIEYLTLQGHLAFRVSNIPVKKRKNTVMKGVGDILGLTKHGKFLSVETKVDDKQSKEQKLFEGNVKQRGGIYVLCKSVDDLIKAGL